MPSSVKFNFKNEYAHLLTDDAVHFLANLIREFRPKLQVLLQNRTDAQVKIDTGQKPSFLTETKEIRESEWKVADIPKPLLDRRVEITGPPDRKMVINALNSGANVFMADFEDSLAPTWSNILSGQDNLYKAVRKTIVYEHPKKGLYKLNKKNAVLFVRPRGLHLNEDHFLIDGKPSPASLFDFGLFMFHNAKEQIKAGLGPYFYLPKLEHYLEARWWNDVFIWSQNALSIFGNKIRATVLLETLPAAFQMDEILFELKDHSAGLNCGRWDYIFSYIKTFKGYPDCILPDRSNVTMDTPFMKSYSERVIQVCHRRGIHAMGGMAAQIPIKNDVDANAKAMTKVKEDKEREVLAGHDGTWVAHPGLVGLSKKVFNKHMKRSNQINKKTDYKCSEFDLIKPFGNTAKITYAGLEQNIRVGILYIESWINGHGCVPINNLMEDTATAEISRAQVWQWNKYSAVLDDGRVINPELVTACIDNVANNLKNSKIRLTKLDSAVKIFQSLCLSNNLINFLTLPAYEFLKGE